MAVEPQTITILCALAAFFTHVGIYSYKSNKNNQCLAPRGVEECEVCSSYINVTLIVRNLLQAPNFEFTEELEGRQGPLRRFLEEAAEVNDGFRFQATYFPGVGYYICTINDVTAETTNHTIWMMISDRAGRLECSADNFIPSDGETILINFTTYTEAGIVY